MDKTIKIDGRDVRFRASALTPRLYRFLTNHDMIRDMNELSKAYKKAREAQEGGTEEEIREAQLSVTDLRIFEDVAYIMARQADPELADLTAEEWLDTFNMFSIYEVMPALLELWHLNNMTTSKPKKK